MKKVFFLGIAMCFLLCGCGEKDALEQVVECQQKDGVLYQEESVHDTLSLRKSEPLKLQIHSSNYQLASQIVNSISSLELEDMEYYVWDEGNFENCMERYKRYVENHSGSKSSIDWAEQVFSVAQMEAEDEEEWERYDEKRKQNTEKLLVKLAEAGLENIFSIYQKIKSDDTYTNFVQKGIRIYFQDGCLMQIDLPVSSMMLPEAYREFMEKNVVDGFYVESYETGGKVDQIILRGGSGIDVQYRKNIRISFQDGEPIQLDIEFCQDEYEKKSSVFSSYEIETVNNLFTYMTGNEQVSKQFIKTFSVKSGKGVLQGRKWDMKKVQMGYRFRIY